MIETNYVFVEKLQDSEFGHDDLARFFEVPFSRYRFKKINNNLYKL